MTRDEILQACCADESTRYAMDKPFVQGAYAWATNGYLAIRTAKWGFCVLATPETGKVPEMMSIWRQPIGDPVALPDVGEPDMEDCPKCSGYGSHECSCGDNHDCGTCGGLGKRASELELTPVDVGEVTLARRYIRLLRRIGVTEVRPTGDKMLHSAYFTVGEFEGLLCQCANKKRGDSMVGGRGTLT
jgi:hypothetical protein